MTLALLPMTLTLILSAYDIMTLAIMHMTLTLILNAYGT